MNPNEKLTVNTLIKFILFENDVATIEKVRIVRE